MLPCFTTQFGNPSSATHRWGWEAEALVTIARERLAALVKADPAQVIFTSGATESISMVLQGISRKGPARILYSSIEHKAVLDNVKWLSELGFETVEIGVDGEGLLKLAQLEDELKKGALLTSIIGANNEIGVVQDLTAISSICSKYGSLLHLDLVQALGKIPISFSISGADFVSLSAHKIYGPKGAGALIIKDRSALTPLIRGGGHEGGLRAGTINVPGVVGFGRAAEILKLEFDSVLSHIEMLSQRLLTQLMDGLPGLKLNGSQSTRIPGNLNIQLPGIKSDRLIAKLGSKIALSNSSACLSGDKNASHVLRAIGLSQTEREASLRIGIGRFNTLLEIDRASELILEAYRAQI